MIVVEGLEKRPSIEPLGSTCLNLRSLALCLRASSMDRLLSFAYIYQEEGCEGDSEIIIKISAYP